MARADEVVVVRRPVFRDVLCAGDGRRQGDPKEDRTKQAILPHIAGHEGSPLTLRLARPEAVALSPWLFVRQAGFFELCRRDAVRAKLNKIAEKPCPGAMVKVRERKHAYHVERPAGFPVPQTTRTPGSSTALRPSVAQALLPYLSVLIKCMKMTCSASQRTELGTRAVPALDAFLTLPQDRSTGAFKVLPDREHGPGGQDVGSASQAPRCHDACLLRHRAGPE